MSISAAVPEVNVPELIDQRKISAFQIRIAVLCAAVVFMDGFDAQAIGYVAPTLSKAWSLKPGELGPVFSAGLFGLMLGALANVLQLNNINAALQLLATGAIIVLAAVLQSLVRRREGVSR